MSKSDTRINGPKQSKSLKKIDYSGWVVIEAKQDSKKANPLEMAEIGLAALQEAAAGTGLEIVR